MSALPADPIKQPDDVYTRQRWIPRHTVEWVMECDRIMVEYGQVDSDRAYSTRHMARHRARRLIRLMVELRLHERWQLMEHTSEKRDGWVWSVEYIRREDDRAATARTAKR